MTKHLALTTQQQFPARAALRTFVQVVVGLPAFLLVLSGILAMVATDAFAAYLPEGWGAWLLAVSVGVASFAALLARIMAIPAVDSWLKRLPGLSLASSPNTPAKPVPDVTQ